MQQLNEIHAAKWREFKGLLILEFKDYCKNISGFAVSIQYSVCLLCLCERYNLKSVIDLGSGFTSYALRKYCKVYNKEIEVHTVDSDPKWLLTTYGYCRKKSLSDANFHLWDSFNDTKLIRADLVSIDIDTSAKRNIYLGEAFKMAKKFAILDDMHKTRIKKGVHTALESMGRKYEYISIKHLTQDGLNRYATLVSLEEQ